MKKILMFCGHEGWVSLDLTAASALSRIPDTSIVQLASMTSRGEGERQRTL